MTNDTATAPEIPADFVATYVEPGTPYVDELNETVPAGWYVHGGLTDVIGEGDRIVIRVEQAYDEDDNDITENVAKAIAEGLNNR